MLSGPPGCADGTLASSWCNLHYASSLLPAGIRAIPQESRHPNPVECSPHGLYPRFPTRHPTPKEIPTVAERYRRFDKNRPHRKINITETGFSVRGRDILKSESAKRTIQLVKEGLIVEKSSRSSEKERAG